jgi:hypothetical protein
LRQRPQSPDAHLEELVFLRLVGQRLTEERLEALAGAQRSSQVDFVITE